MSKIAQIVINTVVCIPGKPQRWLARSDGNYQRTKNGEMAKKYGDTNDYANDSVKVAKKACPNGWHLPSDGEWREMAKKYGGAGNDASDGGKAAYNALIQNGSSGFWSHSWRLTWL